MTVRLSADSVLFLDYLGLKKHEKCQEPLFFHIYWIECVAAAGYSMWTVIVYNPFAAKENTPWRDRSVTNALGGLKAYEADIIFR